MSSASRCRARAASMVCRVPVRAPETCAGPRSCAKRMRGTRAKSLVPARRTTRNETCYSHGVRGADRMTHDVQQIALVLTVIASATEVDHG